MATSAVRYLAEVAARPTSSQAPAQFENNASASAVYHQPLCLGNILSNLPLSDLRSVQLVNRHGWREASRVMYRMVSVKMMDDIKPSPDNGAYYLSLVRVLDDPSITRKREQPELLEGYKKVYKNLHKYLGARRLDPYDNCSLADLALVRIDYCDYHFTTDVTDTENGATRITAHVHLMSRIRKQDWLKGQQVVLPIMSLEKEWDKVEQIPHIGFAPEAGENDGFSDMSQEDDLFFLAGQGKAPSTDADAKEALREEAERAITAHLIDASTLHPDVYMISLRDFEIGLDLKGLGRLCVNRRAFKGVRKISRVHTNLGTSRYEKFSLKKWRRFIKDAGPDLIDLRLFSDGYHVIHWPVLELDRLTSDVLDYCPHLQELHVGLATPESGKVVGLDIYWLDAEWGNDTVEELHLELATDLLRGRKSTPFPLLALSLSLAPIMAKGGRIVLTDQVGMHYWVEQKAAVELHHFQPEINRCVQYLLSLNPATQARIRQVDVKSLRYTASCLDDLKNLLPID